MMKKGFFKGLLYILSISFFALGGMLLYSMFSKPLDVKVKKADDVKDWYLNKVGEATVGKPIVVEGVSYDRYAYQQLDEERQVVYDQIYNCIESFDKSVIISTHDQDVLADAYEAMLADYGDLFYIKGYNMSTYTQGDEVVSVEFEPQYTMDKAQRDVYRSTIESVAAKWLSGISPEATDYEKALYVFETLIKNVDYNKDSKENQNILSVFLYNNTVCQGYADAAWYLLDKLGIKSTVVVGEANNQAHAWNLVYLDKAYYYMDVTWGNSKYLDTDSSTVKRINYAYLAMTSDELSRTHIITSSFPMPECQSTEDNYFVHEGMYYDSFSADIIGAAFATSLNSGAENITMKLSTPELYQQVVEYFFDNRHISDYCRVDSVYYILDEDAQVITVQW